MKIYDPFKNKFADLHSIQGIQLLKKYIKNYQNGGSGTTAAETTTIKAVERPESVGPTDIGSGGEGGGGGKPQEELPKYGSCEGYNSLKQFECIKDIVVVFLGGFHPFHRGHFLSYKQAKITFGGNVCFYVVASNSKPKQKTGNKNIEAVRPFPFEAKKQLAILSGVEEDEIICDMNPMILKNIKKFIPNIDNKLLIIVRSEKELEDELITNENAIEKMTTNILNLKSNNKTEEEVRIYAGEKFSEFINEYNSSMNHAFYKITGRGDKKEFKYDKYQPIPVECYEINEEGKKKFNFKSINLLKLKEGQIGFVHITNTEPIMGGEMDLSSGTKIRKAYINASSEEEKKRILSILYPIILEKPEEYENISAIYDTYLNHTFFENYKKLEKAGKKKEGGKKKGGGKKTKTAKTTKTSKKSQ